MLDEISTVSIWVSNLDQALDFYVNTLGLEKRVDTANNLDGIRWLTVAPHGSHIEIFLGQADLSSQIASPWGRFSGIIFRTRDMESTYSILLDRGVEFAQTPTPQPWGGIRAQFRDPDGNVHALVQEPDWGNSATT